MTAPTIVNVSPVPDVTGVVLGDTIKVYFDQEMDETTINTGTLVVSGPSSSFVFGPDYIPLDEPGVDEEDILTPPGIGGYVKGVITFQRVDAYGVEVSTLDTTGDGSQFRTLAIFTPSYPLQPNRTYTVLVMGDEDASDDVHVGVSARTVFDTINFSVSGTGQVTFSGGYNREDGPYTETYVVEIITEGAVGTAEYQWYKASNPTEVGYGTTSTGARLLEYGVLVTCDPDGSFEVGDTFKVVVKPPERLEDNYEWDFTTGSGALIEPPTVEETSTTVSLAEPFEIVSITPAHRSTNLDPDSIGTYASRIEIVFSKNIDPSTITDETVLIWSESVNGDPQFQADGVLAKVLSVEGDTLTIQLS